MTSFSISAILAYAPRLVNLRTPQKCSLVSCPFPGELRKLCRQEILCDIGGPLPLAPTGNSFRLTAYGSRMREIRNEYIAS